MRAPFAGAPGGACGDASGLVIVVDMMLSWFI
jgi:hypothetical protein